MEVVCGVTFEQVEGFAVQHVGLLWEAYRKDYPTIDQQPQLPTIIEEPGGIASHSVRLGPSGVGRIWYVSEDTTRILQVQGNRFILNWRRVHADLAYPRFESVYGEFGQRYKQFQQFLRANKLTSVVPVQYEISYVNLLEKSEAQTIFPDFAWRADQRRFLPSPESFSWRTSFWLPDVPGRLYAHIHTNVGEDGLENDAILEITVRGKGGETKQARDRWFTGAHAAAVLGFKDLTSAEARQKWGEQ